MVAMGSASAPGRWVAAAVVVVACLGLLRAGRPRLRAAESDYPADGYMDWGGARQMAAGEDPYGNASALALGMPPGYHNGHPPTTLLWFLPFARLDVMAMKRAFNAITLVMLAGHVLLVAAALALPHWPLVALVAFSVAVRAPWMLVHLSQVDLSEPIAFLLALAWWALRRRRDVAGGALVGLACTLKLYPGVLGVFLLLAGRWRAAAAAVAVYLVFVLAAVRRLGPRAFSHFAAATGPYADKWGNSIRNASITGIVQRIYYPCWQFPYGHPVSRAGNVIAAGLALGLVVAAWLVVRRTVARANDATALDVPFALFTVVAIAPGPYQWEHYAATLILPFLVLLSRALRERVRWPWFAALAAIAAALETDAQRCFAIPFLAHANPAFLRELRFYEITAWLPWVLLLVALVVVCVRRQTTPLDAGA